MKSKYRDPSALDTALAHGVLPPVEIRVRLRLEQL